jgi:SAM-dependent methyltransferase
MIKPITHSMDSLERWRLKMVLPLIRGSVCDVGCGYNNLTRNYSGPGVAVDVHPWPGVDVVIKDVSHLPFRDHQFDTVTVLAALNHFPDRPRALREIRRVLKPEGRLVFTMIGPLTGIVAHMLFRNDEAVRGGFHKGEALGLSRREIRRLLQVTGFQLADIIPFQLGLNAVYVATKPR